MSRNADPWESQGGELDGSAWGVAGTRMAETPQMGREYAHGTHGRSSIRADTKGSRRQRFKARVTDHSHHSCSTSELRLF